MIGEGPERMALAASFFMRRRVLGQFSAAATSKGFGSPTTISSFRQGSGGATQDVLPCVRYAIVRGVPDSFGHAVTMEPKISAIDVGKAKEQHANYVSVLKGLVGEVIELAADETHPDCPFVEDTAVVVGSRALIARMGNDSRKGEEAAVARVIRELGLDVVEMGGGGQLDGGDVLPIADHLFVGLSSRTNAEGTRALAAAFPETRVIPVNVRGTGGLHLKSVMTWLGRQALLVEHNPATILAYNQIIAVKELAALDLVAHHVPEPGAANTCIVNGCVLYPSALAGECTASLVGLGGGKPIPVDISEFHKADGGLTCLSILVP